MSIPSLFTWSQSYNYLYFSTSSFTSSIHLPLHPLHPLHPQ
jgi:hypothetical protein